MRCQIRVSFDFDPGYKKNPSKNAGGGGGGVSNQGSRFGLMR